MWSGTEGNDIALGARERNQLLNRTGLRLFECARVFPMCSDLKIGARVLRRGTQPPDELLARRLTQLAFAELNQPGRGLVQDLARQLRRLALAQGASLPSSSFISMYLKALARYFLVML